jgi:hypothetical protein
LELFVIDPFDELYNHKGYSLDPIDEHGPRRLNVMAIKAAIVHKNLRPSLPLESECCPQAFSNLIKACWAGVPSERPTFSDIVDTLCDLLGVDDEDAKLVREAKQTADLPNISQLNVMVDPSSTDAPDASLSLKEESILNEVGTIELPALVTAAIFVQDSATDHIWLGFANGTIGIYSLVCLQYNRDALLPLD